MSDTEANTRRKIRHVEPACCRCERPERLHCPGCNACWPDDVCSPYCDDPKGAARMATRVAAWIEAHSE